MRVPGMVATATVLMVLGSSVAAAAGSSPPQVTMARWQQAVQRLQVPGRGCFTASYPVLRWHRTRCKPAPRVSYAPAPGPRPQAVGHGTGYTRGHDPVYTVGDGTDYVAQVPGSLSSVMGSFDTVTPTATEKGSFNGGPQQANTFTLQLNTNLFSTSQCSGSSNPGCMGWEQFVYSTHFNMVIVEFTLVNYLTFGQTCPPGWHTHSPDCVMNTFGSALPTNLTVADLPGVTLTGSVSPGGNDKVELTTSSGSATAASADSTLGLAGHWNQVEWGIFGEAGPIGNSANFSPGTTLVARTTTHNGSKLAPACQMGGTTAETNNLSLTPMFPIGIQPHPTLLSTQTNGSAGPGTVACATADGLRDPHLRTFSNLFYDFQGSGDFELATTGPGFTVEDRQQSSAPMWPNADSTEAIGARVGTSDVAVCTAPTRLMINKKRVGLPSGGHISLPGGASVSLNGNVYLIRDAAGDSVTAAVNTGSPDWIDSTVGLATWPETVHGLLASAGTNPDAVQSRSGAVYTPPFSFNSFYNAYGNSWRVPASQSLLSACGGKVASGNPQNVFYASNLPTKTADTARAECVAAGVQAPPLLDACTVDVAVLGNKAPLGIYATIPANVFWGKINPPAANHHTIRR